MEWYTTSSGEYEFHKEVTVEAGHEYQYKFRIGEGDWWTLNEDSPTGRSTPNQSAWNWIGFMMSLCSGHRRANNIQSPTTLAIETISLLVLTSIKNPTKTSKTQCVP